LAGAAGRLPAFIDGARTSTMSGGGPLAPFVDGGGASDAAALAAFVDGGAAAGTGPYPGLLTVR
jgi:hypothetical protein